MRPEEGVLVGNGCAFKWGTREGKKEGGVLYLSLSLINSVTESTILLGRTF